jgi:hypothetical protein
MKKKLPDLKSLSGDELAELLNRLVDEHQELNLKITTAKARAKTEKVYLSPERFHNLNYARNQVNKKLRRVEQELNRRKRTRKTLGDHFMDIAHALLEEETFQAILTEAKIRASST